MKSKIDYALSYAMQAHEETYRKSTGVPFIIHPLKVLEQIRLWGIYNIQIGQAALLHDVLEDTNVTFDQLHVDFGWTVASIVRELTFDGSTSKEEYLKSFKDKSIEALVIKVADRLSNVMDFFAVDASYSYVYYRKAYSLQDVFLDKYLAIKDTFSIEVLNNIQNTYNKVWGEIQWSGPKVQTR